MSGGGAADAHHQPIIIVKRHGDHEDGHHGGAWKIAFADFMTAMMCFFLVMWLINAANEQTKASVASYFNPVKLVDRNTAKKGLEENGEGAQSAGVDSAKADKGETKGGKEAESSGGPADNAAATQVSETPVRTDSSLFADPYAVLAEIAAETGKDQNVSEKGEGGAQSSGPATGASGGDAYRDPFAPDFWTSQVAVPSVAEASAERSAPAPADAEPGDSAPTDAQGPAEVAPSQAGQTPEAAPVPEARPAPEPSPEKAEASPKPEGPSAEAEKVAAEIRAELEKSFGPADKAAKDVSVEATDKGVVISVTEGLDFGMFEIGSAVPQSALVHAMDKIGAAIRNHPGTVTIQGHTDARPFHGAAYDNWRLSTARAHAAYYMLLRAGLAEKRVVEVAGFADRKPKNKADPLAPENRRIEILVEVGG